MKFLDFWRRASAIPMLCCALGAFGQTASLSLSPASGGKGSTVSLPLAYASNGAQAADVQWMFSYSPADFTNVSVTAGAAAANAGKTVLCNSPSSGRYICLASGLNTNTISNGIVANASFTLSSTTSSTSSNIQVLSAMAASAPGAAIAATGTGATVTINGAPLSTSLSDLSCAPASVTAPASSQCTVTLSGPAGSGGTAVSTGFTSTAAAVTMPASVTVAAGATTAPFSVQIGAVTASTAVQISASLGSVTKTSTISVAPAGVTSSGPVSFWPSTATPANLSASDANPVEVGLQFSSSVAGSVTGVRFYKGPANTGTHVGHLWSAAGTLLASATFTDETASGWQQANFSTPVNISANTVYVISYFAPKGGYSYNQNFAWGSLSAAPLSVSGNSPGVNAYASTSSFPRNPWYGGNYWVDVVFAAGAATPPPPPPPPAGSTVSFWPATTTPANLSATDTNSVELGLQFSSSATGSVVGVRFYKGSANTGTHVGHLWSASGTLLASVTFTNETASGWQQASFSTPVNISANTVYVISYFAPKGGYSYNQNFAWGSLNADPLSVAGNSPGVNAYGFNGSFPKSPWYGGNYWVDVVFKP